MVKMVRERVRVGQVLELRWVRVGQVLELRWVRVSIRIKMF